jgi:hypothetical protein
LSLPLKPSQFHKVFSNMSSLTTEYIINRQDSQITFWLLYMDSFCQYKTDGV